MELLLLIIPVVILLFILNGFGWKDLATKTGTPNLGGPTLQTKLLAILQYFCKALCQLLVACAKCALRMSKMK